MSRAQQSCAQGSTKMPSGKSTSDKVNGNESAKPVGGPAKRQQLRNTIEQKSRTRFKKGTTPSDAVNSLKTDVLAAGDFSDPSALTEISQQFRDSGDLRRPFSARLRDLPRARALSLRKLGREVGVTANTVLRR